MSNTEQGLNAEFYDQFKKEYEEQLKKLGCFNLAVFGNTGAGKSSLVNAVFGRVVARTGIGKPVTSGIDYHRHPSGAFGVFDCQGFETGEAGNKILKNMRKLVEDRRRRPLNEQIHVAWYAIRYSDRRFEDSQARFVRELDHLGLPVIVVMTQVPLLGETDKHPHPDAVELARHIAGDVGEVIVGGHPILTNAVADPHLSQPVHGLVGLLDATFRVAPEGVKAAIVATQIVDKERKHEQCGAVIGGAVAAATGIGATPIPFADAVLLVPVQVTMMASISARYALPVDSATVATLAGGAALAGGATVAGRAVANLAKMVPGIGSVVGGAINATIAGALTGAVGWAWVKVCDQLCRLPADELDLTIKNKAILGEMFINAFKEYLGRRPSKGP